MPYADIEDRRRRDATYYAANAEKVKAREKAKYEANTPVIRARRLELSTPDLRARNAERERLRYAALAAEMIQALGGACACCGELDHIQNDGAEHRRTIGRGAKGIYNAAKREGWPRDRYQILCANCNQGKKRNGGRCPHHG